MIARNQNTAQSLISALFLLICAFNCPPAQAKVRLPAIVSNHMVVQGNSNPRIWGWADPSEKIEVKYLGNTLKAEANSAGKWEVRLGKLKPGTKFDIVIKGDNELTITDVLVGEVWVCAGQSNMDFQLLNATNAAPEWAWRTQPQIRFFKIELITSRDANNDVKGSWEIYSPQAAKSWSAVGYFFAKELNAQLREPVGMIQAAVGGSMAHVWMSREGLAKIPSLGPTWAHDENVFFTPSYLFNGMINGITPYTIRGITWYQGESNDKEPETYRKVFPALINDWRTQWKDDNLPFLFVQLPNHGKATPPNVRSKWAEVREAQSLALKLKNTAMIVTIDVGDPKELHPRNKKPVGHRLALGALAMVYHQKIPFKGPVISSMETKNGALVCHFVNTEKGLRARNHKKLIGFQIAGVNSHFVPAKATINGTTITISSPEVPNPTELKYAWSDSPDGNLENGYGLPAPPFRIELSAPKPQS